MGAMNWDKVARQNKRDKDKLESDPYVGQIKATRFDSAIKTIQKNHPTWLYAQVVEVAQNWLEKIKEKERA